MERIQLLKQIVLSLFIGLVIIGCMETDAKVMQLEQENTQLQDEILMLVDSIDVVMTNKNLEIINLNATIQAKDYSFDSLMTLWDAQLSDTTYLDTLRSRLVKILNKN